MKLLLKYFFVFFLLVVASCQEKHPYGDPLVKLEVILKSQANFVNLILCWSSRKMKEPVVGVERGKSAVASPTT